MSGERVGLTIEDVARFPRPGTVVPGRIGFTPDGAAVTYLFSAEGNLVRSLWRYEIATGERRVIAGPPPQQEFSRDEELRRERMRQREAGVTDYAYATTAEPPVLLIPQDGALTLRFGNGAEGRRLPGTEGAIDPRLNTAGTRVAFVREGNLFVVDVASGESRQLTSDAVDGLTNGVAEFIAQEELDQPRGFWWSDDGTRIAFTRVDSRHIPVYPIVHQGKDEVDIEPHRYPFAGQPNAFVQLGVVDAETGATTWMDLGPERDVYLARVLWRPDGKLTAQVLSRGQGRLTTLVFDGGESRVLLEESTAPWFNLGQNLRFLDSGEFVRTGEESGFRHLYLHAADGAEIRQLTAGDWVVTHVIALDKAGRRVYFAGTREGVTERHVYAVSLHGGETERLTTGPGWHDAVFSNDCGRWVEVHSSLAHGPRLTLRGFAGEAPVLLFANEHASAGAIGLAPPEMHTFPAEDGTPLQALLYRPAPAPVGGGTHPLVVSVYGGPHVQRVADEWSNTVDMRAQYLAQHGYAVLKVDNRGSANRGLAFEAHIHRAMGSVEVTDQVAAVQWAARTFDFIDPARTGIYGWSYGGYMTLMCMLRAPEVFHVGVAGAPVTHWDNYDTGYTERYMSTPQLNPEGYRESSPLTHIEQLAGKLMVVHGMIDENVHFRNTARLLVAMATAAKEYELLIYPEERHMPRDQKGMEDQERKVLGFIERNLGGGS